MMHIHSYSRFRGGDNNDISIQSFSFSLIVVLLKKKCQWILRDLRGFLRIEEAAN